MAVIQADLRGSSGSRSVSKSEDNAYSCALGDREASKFIPDTVPSFIQEWIVVTK